MEKEVIKIILEIYQYGKIALQIISIDFILYGVN